MNDYVIAIPSYKRPETLKLKTLRYLQDCKIDLRKVTVFLADENQLNDYVYLLKDYPEIKFVIAVPGIKAVRNFILDFYPIGSKVFSIDDDIEGLYIKLDDRRTDLVKDLDLIIRNGFEVCQSTKTRLWGINAVLNPYFMKNTVTTDLKFIVGCFYGFIKHENFEALRVTIDNKEDYERTIKCYLVDGGVVRFNYLAPKTKYYREPGGLQETRTLQAEANSALYLVKTYPNLCSISKSEPNEPMEIRLRDKLRRSGSNGRPER